MEVVKLDYTGFDFSIFRTFKGVDITSIVIGLAKGYSQTDPIPDKSILIYYPTNSWTDNNEQNLSNMLQCGTKPFNAIMYLQFHTSPSHKDAFVVKHDMKVQSSSNQVKAIKMILAAVLMFISRGQLPAAQNASSTTPNPRFMKDTLGINIKSEGTFRKMLMDFDPKHLSMELMFRKPENFAGWDDIVKNRMLLGVAGHKPLKALRMLYPLLTRDMTDDKGRILQELYKGAQNIHTGFYPSLHPSIQAFAPHYPNFYKNVMRLICEKMGGDIISNQQRIKRLGMFKKDEFVNNEITTYEADLNGWDIDKIVERLGDLITFGAKKGQIQITKKIELKQTEYDKSKEEGSDEEEEEEEEEIETDEEAHEEEVKPKLQVPKKAAKKKTYEQEFV